MKSMFPDALTDPVLAKYLPSRAQLSDRLPEKEFFFGVMSTLKRQYMADVIAEAHAKRFKLQEGDESKRGIVLSEAWSRELLKHPFLSRKGIRKANRSRQAWHGHLSYEGARQALQGKGPARDSHDLEEAQSAPEQAGGSQTRHAGDGKEGQPGRRQVEGSSSST